MHEKFIFNMASNLFLFYSFILKIEQISCVSLWDHLISSHLLFSDVAFRGSSATLLKCADKSNHCFEGPRSAASHHNMT